MGRGTRSHTSPALEPAQPQGLLTPAGIHYSLLLPQNESHCLGSAGKALEKPINLSEETGSESEDLRGGSPGGRAMPAVAAVPQAEVTAPLRWQRADSSKATPRPKCGGSSPWRKVTISQNPYSWWTIVRTPFTLQKSFKKITLVWWENITTSLWPQTAPGPAVVATSGAAWALLEIRES